MDPWALISARSELTLGVMAIVTVAGLYAALLHWSDRQARDEDFIARQHAELRRLQAAIAKREKDHYDAVGHD